MTRYSNRAISTAQVIEELIGLAKTITSAIEEGRGTGLSEEEVAFYQALSDNESAREVLKDDALRVIARELAENIKRKATLDWTQRDAVRADMRRTVRRLGVGLDSRRWAAAPDAGRGSGLQPPGAQAAGWMTRRTGRPSTGR